MKKSIALLKSFFNKVKIAILKAARYVWPILKKQAKVAYHQTIRFFKYATKKGKVWFKKICSWVKKQILKLKKQPKQEEPVIIPEPIIETVQVEEPVIIPQPITETTVQVEEPIVESPIIVETQPVEEAIVETIEDTIKTENDA